MFSSDNWRATCEKIGRQCRGIEEAVGNVPYADSASGGLLCDPRYSQLCERCPDCRASFSRHRFDFPKGHQDRTKQELLQQILLITYRLSSF